METGNKLIAEFLGHKSEVKEYGDKPLAFLIKSQWYALSKLKYHSSYDWLMRVVEKIESLGYVVSINNKHCRIKRDVLTLISNRSDFLVEVEIRSVKSKIESVWCAVVAFIEWYNTTQSK